MSPMPDPPAASQVGTRIRTWRLAKNLSQADVAELLGTTNQQVGRLESGQRKVTVDWLYRIADAFGITVLDLLEGSAELAGVGADLADILCAVERHWNALGTDYARTVFTDDLMRAFPCLGLEQSKVG